MSSSYTLRNFAFSRALEIVWSIIARVDKMITDARTLGPGQRRKPAADSERNPLSFGGDACAGFAVLLHPVMPVATQQIYSQLGLNTAEGDVLRHLKPGGAQLGWHR